MKTRIAVAALLLIVAVAPLAADHHESKYKFAEEVPPRNDINIENRVAVPMRDGVILYADIFRPTGEGKHPVLVSRTPYSTERYPSSYSSGSARSIREPKSSTTRESSIRSRRSTCNNTGPQAARNHSEPRA